MEGEAARLEGERARLEEGEVLEEETRELTEVGKKMFKELGEANCLQRLVNEDRIEKIKKRNW